MLIRRIELENFRQFKGKQAIEFSTNLEKPVTVILGQNTGGKTTLVRAIGWCLYGGDPADLGFSKDSYFLNAEEVLDLLETKKEKTVEVTLILESKRFVSFDDPTPHDFQYRITRKKSYFAFENQEVGKINNKLKSRVKIIERDLSCPDSNEREILSYTEQQKIIDLIMPKDLSEYFFYWGESIHLIRKSKKLQSAIETFTGLSVYTEAKKDVNEVRNSYKRQASHTAGVDNELTQLEKEKEDLQKELEDHEHILEEARKKEDFWAQEESEAQRAFYAVKDDEARTRTIEELRSDVTRREQEKKDKQKEFIKKFSQENACYAFIHRKAGKLLEELDGREEKIDSFGWSYLTANAIREILTRGVCVCGLDLSEHPEAKAHLEEEIRRALPNALEGYVQSLKTNYYHAENIANSYSHELLRLSKTVFELNDEIIRLQDDLKNEALAGKDPEEFNKRKEDLRKAEEEKKKAIQEISDQKARIDLKKKELDEKEKNISEKEEERIRDEAIKLRYRLANEILNRLKKVSDEKVSAMRTDLQQYIQDYLNEMYHGHRIVNLTPTFQYRVKTEVNGNNNLENDTSPGLETVLNFAFVAALLTLAREVRQKDKNNLEKAEMSEPYPLVLDAPFSQTDETHILNICKVITRVAEQTILIIMEKDWNIAQKALGNRVGYCYEIDKHSESVSTIRKIEG